jgi:hypothetical protein
MQDRLPRHHPHVVRISTWIQRYDDGELDPDELQRNLNAIWLALEGDLPASFRRAVRHAQSKLEVSVVSGESSELSAEADDALEELRRQIGMAR